MSFSAKVEDEAIKRARGQCAKCDGQLKPGKFHFHHIVPKWKGGDDTADNIQVLCIRCHLEAELDHDFATQRTADRKAKLKAKLPVASGEPEIARRFKND